jgi:hypothetical protein
VDLLAPGLCQTRFLKTARFLQRTAPDVLPPGEPVEGFRSILDGSDPSMRYLLRDALGPGKVPPLRSAPTPTELRGPLLLLSPIFETRKGPFSVPESDVAVIVEYLRRAVSLVGRYLAPYATIELEGPLPPVPVRVPLATNRFSDAQVASWVAAAATTRPGAAGCVVLAPGAVVNSDADASTSARGYHAVARIPYLFLNVPGARLQLDDPADAFALALSHHLLEMASDPLAEFENPELCDPCSATTERACRNYFGGGGEYLASGAVFPPGIPYAFFLQGVARAGSSLQGEASLGACGYAPPPALC